MKEKGELMPSPGISGGSAAFGAGRDAAPDRRWPAIDVLHVLGLEVGDTDGCQVPGGRMVPARSGGFRQLAGSGHGGRGQGSGQGVLGLIPEPRRCRVSIGHVHGS